MRSLVQAGPAATTVLDSKQTRNNGHSHWQVESAPSALNLGRKTSKVVVQWERDSRSSLRKRFDELIGKARAQWRVSRSEPWRSYWHRGQICTRRNARVTRNLDRIGLEDEMIGRSGLTSRKDSGTIGPHVAQRVLRP